jgi:molybdate transport system permease protein
MTLRPGPFAWLCGAALGVTLAFVLLPLVGLVTDVPPAELLEALGDRAALEALGLSLVTSLTALALIVTVGTPAAWLLATRRVPGRALVLTLVELPLVMPPAVAGVALLTAFGPEGLLGPALDRLGIRLALETAGVVVALTFVAAPFYLRQAISGFETLDREQLDVAADLGAGEATAFARVAAPIARPALGAGAALAWARALGEFGATLIFAGSLQGVTQTAPLAVYDRLGTDFTGALALSVVLVALSGGILLGVRLIGGAARTLTTIGGR